MFQFSYRFQFYVGTVLNYNKRTFCPCLICSLFLVIEYLMFDGEKIAVEVSYCDDKQIKKKQVLLFIIFGLKSLFDL